MISTVSIPTQITEVVDDTTIEVSAGKIRVKNDGIGKAKLNADIVGIATATGKVNAINTTNFTSLDAVNLTNTGDMVKIGTYTPAGGGTTVDTDAFDVSAYKDIFVVADLVFSTASALYLRLNADGTSTNYRRSYTQLEADAHSTANDDLIGASSTLHYVRFWAESKAGANKRYFGINVGDAGEEGSVATGVFSPSGALTKVGFRTGAGTVTSATITVWGIK